MNLKRILFERVQEFDELCTKSGDIDQYLSKPTIIFGACEDGAAIYTYLKENKKLEPIAFCENSPEKKGKTYLDLPIHSLDEIVEKYDLKDVTIINFSTKFFKEIEKELARINLPDNSYLNLYHICALDENFLDSSKEVLSKFKGFEKKAWYFSPKFKGNFWAAKWPGIGYNDMSYSKVLLANEDKILELYNCLSDQESKETLEKYIYAMANERISAWERYCIRKSIVSPDKQYFVDEIIKIKENETFINAGAYGGYEVIEFNKLSKGKYAKIISFEPDKDNFEQLKTMPAINDLPNQIILNEALYDKNCILSFSQDGTGSSSINTGQGMQITAVSLDLRMEELGIKDVSFIKMDIEGSEIPALMGAENIIKKNKPKLAICIYHKPEDIFMIPLLIKKMLPDYKLYIRSHDFVYELVCYAVYDN